MTTTHGLRPTPWPRRVAAGGVTLLLAAAAAGCSGRGAAEGPHPAQPQARVLAAGPPAPRPVTTTAAPRPPAFAPVVTDRIPTPSVTLPLSAVVPGTTNMQPAAADAFARAFAAARAAGLDPQIRSAWRSAAFQQVLFDRAVARYGSVQAASNWVLPPSRSAHVKGYAVDVHPQAVAAWLEVHGAAFGICRTYANEWWHFEYLATSTCPPRLPTAAG
ncbi:D-alanyl-D-alanine carboxypeptidase family protein [Pedococcus sp. NPDC057267]|uniref:D-alanyl-D-alanine carboxypeptidase family protein n=1 Tax=Pedococcus sp. NPDC057267 TaxID=3346077 RepID=UPI003637E2B3